MDVNKNKNKLLIKIVFAVYLLFLAYVLFFAEAFGRQGETDGYRYNLTLFHEIARYIRIGKNGGWEQFMVNIIGNILAFVPFGFFAPLTIQRCRHVILTAMLSFELSLLVEILQLITKVGSFDVDDLFLNTVGGIIGFGIYLLGKKIKNKVFTKEGQ